MLSHFCSGGEAIGATMHASPSMVPALGIGSATTTAFAASLQLLHNCAPSLESLLGGAATGNERTLVAEAMCDGKVRA
jgi:hypothetical protein